MSDKKDWRLIEFFTPINEFKEDLIEGKESDFIIRGVAINETTTHNGHKYVAEELQKASSHLIGKKLLVDHRNEVDAIKGVIKNSWFNPTEKRIEFEGSVKDKTIKEMIKDGRLSDVSIGAYATDLVKEDNGSLIAKGLQIVELSFVAVPADSKANFAMAMDNNYAIKESLNLIEMSVCPECKKEFEDKEEMLKHKKEKHPTESYLRTERRYGEMEENKIQEMEKSQKELTESNQKMLEELNILRNERRQNIVSEYKKLCSEKKVKEKDVSTHSDETIKLLIEQLKEVIVEEKSFKSQVVPQTDINLTGLDNVMIERTDKGMAMFLMPNTKELRELHANLPFFKK